MLSKIITYGIVTGCLLALSGASCEKGLPLQPAPFRPDMRVENFTTSSYQDGMLIWELKAKESSYYYNENRSIAEDIVLNYYDNDKISAVVRSDKAIIDTDSRDIDLIGNVDMLSTSGSRLLTQRIKWNNRDKLLDTDEPIKILKKNGDLITGIGLRANYDLEDYEIKRKVIAITKEVGNYKNKRGGR